MLKGCYIDRVRIQDLHQVQYRFDALQPQFTNKLRAFHRRRWTTQVRFGHLNQNHGHASAGEVFPKRLDHNTPNSPNTPQEIAPRPTNPLATNNNNIPLDNQHHTNSYPTYNNESTLNAAINLLNLNTRTIPPTPTNSIASLNSFFGNLMAAQSTEPNFYEPYPTMQQNCLGYDLKIQTLDTT